MIRTQPSDEIRRNVSREPKPMESEIVDKFAKYLLHNTDWGVFCRTLEANDFGATIDTAAVPREVLPWESDLIEIYNRLSPFERRFLKQRAEERTTTLSR